MRHLITVLAIGCVLTVPAWAHVAQQGGDTGASATAITSLPFSDVGTTVGYANDYGNVCRTAPAPDVVYVYTPPVNVVVDIETCGSSYDTVLYVFEGSCPGTVVVCNDDSCGLQSELFDVALTAGTTYYIVVDGYSPGSSGVYQIYMAGRPTCPYNSMFGQAPFRPDVLGWNGYAADRDAGMGYLIHDNMPLPVPNEICAVRWWGFNWGGMNPPCDDTADTFEITLTSGTTTVHSVTATKVNTGIIYTSMEDFPLYEFTAELPDCYSEVPVWIAIEGYGDPGCWFWWATSPDGDAFSLWDPLGPAPMDFAFCLLYADCDGDGVPDDTEPDSDGDGVIDDCDDCPGTAGGEPVDADGCSTLDDDGDGVFNDEDDCPGTPGCATVDADGCSLDGDDDGVADGCDDCPGTAAGDPVDSDGCSTADDDGDGVLNDDDLCAGTPTCATNVDGTGCAIDTDGDGNVDGCEPPPQTCCGATGPVAPLGLAVGMLLLARVGRRRRRVR